MSRPTDRPVRVLQSVPEPRPTTNPYVVQLLDGLRASREVDVRTFSWPRALGWRYDVLHVHWPENLLTGNGRARTAVRQLLFALLLLRSAARRTVWVRTVHNLRPQERRTGLTAALLRRAEARTSLHVWLNDRTPAVDGVPGVVVRHGHYRDWFAEHPARPPARGRLAFVGLIRPYKDVPGLLAAFADVPADATLRLHVAGAPRTPDLADLVRRAAAADGRVTLTLRHLDDAELVAAVTEAELVVLPYQEMHNSGAVLLALSLDRPVLVPDNAVNADLAAEVGPGWVLRYRGPLTADTLTAAAAAAADTVGSGRPDLSRREWVGAVDAHVAAYRAALAQRGAPAG